MGRAPAGKRRQISLRLPDELVERIDSARGMTSRDAWMIAAAELALKPTSAIEKPELREKAHMHYYRQLVATKFADGKKYRTFRCTCGIEREEQTG